MTIPTAITLSRLLVAVAMVAAFQLLDRPLADWVAAGLLALGAAGDFLDGYLARRMNTESLLGQVLDPIADKVLVAAALLVVVAYSGPVLSAFLPFAGDCRPSLEMLPVCGPIEVPAGYVVVPAALIFCREFLVSGARELLPKGTAILRVTGLAKWKSAAQMIALLVLVSTGALSSSVSVHVDGPVRFRVGYPSAAPAVAGTAGIAMIWIACLLTLVTGADYLAKAVRILRRG